MIQDLIVSFKENIKGKTTNPFFGTLIIVWIFHNWRLMYSIFNFDKSTSLEMRITFLADYLDSKNLIPDLLTCILITIIVLITTYILLNFSRLIVNFFEKIVTPIVYQITDKSSIVLKRDYQLLEAKRERFEKKFEQERESRLKLQDEYERLESRLGEALQSKTSEKKQDPPSSISSRKENILRSILNDEEKRNSFRKMVDIVLNKQYVKDTAMTNLMLRLNLVEKGGADYDGDYNFNFTSDGKRLREMLIEYDATNNQ